MTAPRGTADSDEHASDRGLVEGVLAGRRLEAWALWCQLSMIADLVQRWTEHAPATDEDTDGCGDEESGEGSDGGMRERCARRLASAQQRARSRMPTAGDLVEEFVAAEVSLACGLSRPAADARVLAAQVLLVEGILPRTARLLERGLLDWSKVQLLVTRVGIGMDPALAGAVEAQVIRDEDVALAEQMDDAPASGTPDLLLPAATRMTVSGLGQVVEATILALDAEEAARRAQRARRERRVVTWTDRDGMGRLEASTGQEHVAAMWNALTAAAHAAKKNRDPRSVDQLRLDEMVRRITGRTPYHSPPDEEDASNPGDEARCPATGHACDAGTDGRPAVHDSTAAPAAATAPPPESGPCRCGEGSRLVGARWAVSLTLPLGTFLGLVDDPGVLDGYGPLAGSLARRIAADAADAARGNPRRTTWRCVIVDDVHRSVLGVGQAFSVPQHDPPQRLADLVRTVIPRCAFPGCPLPARRCDLDHRIPYDRDDPAAGGPTCECNLQSLCRTHHRLKTTGLITVQPVARDVSSGGLEWTTRAGLRWRTSPAPVTPPPAPAALQPLLEMIERQRRESDQRLAWINTALRAAYGRGRRKARSDLLDDVDAELRAEIRHHEYGQLAHAADPDDPDLPPEPAEPDRDEPGWMRAVRWTVPDEPDLEPDHEEPDHEEPGDT